MITGIIIKSMVGLELLSLPVGTKKDGSVFIVKNIDGLEAVEATISVLSSAPVDGDVYQDSRIGSRNIVMDVAYCEDGLVHNDVSGLRRELYRLIPPKTQAMLIIQSSDMEDVSIFGVVESIDTAIFSKDPQVQISIVCPDSVFEVSEESVQMGTVGQIEQMNYSATGSSGFLFELFVRSVLKKVVLETAEQSLTYEGELLPGDVLTISTLKGKKYVRKRNPSGEVSVLKGLKNKNLDMAINSRNRYLTVKTKSGDKSTFRVSYSRNYVGL